MPAVNRFLRHLLALLLVALPAAHAESPCEPTHLGSVLSLLDLWIEEQRAHQGIPGLSIGIVHDQALVWAKGYGVTDLATSEPATAATLYRIGSLTKVLTATATLQLRDSGRLALDDPVTRFLPGLELAEPFPGGPQITVHHLLTHTSGLPREGPFPYWTTHEFPELPELLASLRGLAPSHPAGDHVRYSNLGMALLGAVVAEASGMPWAETLERQIFAPLGMSSSTASPKTAQQERLATPYMRRLPDGSRRIHDLYDTGALAPAANAVSSVEDLARFAALQLRDRPGDDHQVLRSATIREMHRPHALEEDWSSGRSLGYGVSRSDGRTLLSHGGWIGGHRSHLLLSPGERIAVIVMTNADDANPTAFTRRAYEMVSSALAGDAAGREPPAAADAGWQRYVGHYSDPWGWEYRVLVMGADLVMYAQGYPPRDDPRAGLAQLEPVEDAEHHFRLPDGDPVIFELDTEGRVERVQRRHDFLFPAERVMPADHSPASATATAEGER